MYGCYPCAEMNCQVQVLGEKKQANCLTRNSMRNSCESGQSADYLPEFGQRFDGDENSGPS
jgi:hypothetical protein